MSKITNPTYIAMLQNVYESTGQPLALQEPEVKLN